jgi:hypothetical protein
MKIFKSKKCVAFMISLPLIFILGMNIVEEPQKIKIAGRQEIAYTNQEIMDFGDVEGHSLVLGRLEGININTGEHKFMDSAQIAAVVFSDLIKGNGHHKGYNKIYLNEDAVFYKYEGKTTTTLSPDGESVTTMEGAFTFARGTGKYENIQGDGTYKAKLLLDPNTVIIIEWAGEYFIKKQ